MKTKERVLTALKQYQKDNLGQAPSCQNIADVIGINRVTVWQHLTNMYNAGILKRVRDKFVWVENQK